MTNRTYTIPVELTFIVEIPVDAPTKKDAICTAMTEIGSVKPTINVGAAKWRTYAYASRVRVLSKEVRHE